MTLSFRTDLKKELIAHTGEKRSGHFEYGRHGLSCSKAAGRFRRHEEANKLIKKALASIEIPNTLEPVGLSTTDGKHPDSLSHFTWKNGKNLI